MGRDRKMLPLKILLLFGKIYFSLAFNIDLENPIVFNPSNNDKGLFGHSVALTGSKAFIGDPESDNHGNLFQCNVDNGSSCKKLEITAEGGHVLSSNQKYFMGARITTS